jgi:hypothetical protein
MVVFVLTQIPSVQGYLLRDGLKKHMNRTSSEPTNSQSDSRYGVKKYRMESMTQIKQVETVDSILFNEKKSVLESIKHSWVLILDGRYGAEFQ